VSDQSDHDRNIRAAERAHDNVNALARIAAEASTKDAQEAIKISFLINGGATVAVLAFLSTFATKPGITAADLRVIAHSLFWFIAGIIFAGITAAIAYLTNSLYAGNFLDQERVWEHPYVKETTSSKRKFRWARRFNWIGFILAWISLLLFICGVFVAAKGILSLVGKS
jgi:hypothetical protein